MALGKCAVVIGVLAMIAGCVTTEDGGGASNGSPRREVASGETLRLSSLWQAKRQLDQQIAAAQARPVGEPHTAAVMAMDWPDSLKPLVPVTRRVFTTSPQADLAYRLELEGLDTSEGAPYRLNPAIMAKMGEANTVGRLLSALDYARDRTIDDQLSTSFSLLYARLLKDVAIVLKQDDLLDTAVLQIIYTDMVSVIDTARCGGNTPADGVAFRWRNYEDLYALARQRIPTWDAEHKRRLVPTLRTMERRTAPIRKDEVLCRRQSMYWDTSKAKKVDCGLKGVTCFASPDDPTVATIWADDEKWRAARIRIMEGLETEEILAHFSRPMGMALFPQ
jgi:hypothetical protein